MLCKPREIYIRYCGIYCQWISMWNITQSLNKLILKWCNFNQNWEIPSIIFRTGWINIFILSAVNKGYNESLSAEIVIMSAENSFVCINASAGCIFAIGLAMPDYPVGGSTSLFTWGEILRKSFRFSFRLQYCLCIDAFINKGIMGFWNIYK